VKPKALSLLSVCLCESERGCEDFEASLEGIFGYRAACRRRFALGPGVSLQIFFAPAPERMFSSLNTSTTTATETMQRMLFFHGTKTTVLSTHLALHTGASWLSSP
jgi:hypothetical protein